MYGAIYYFGRVSEYCKVIIIEMSKYGIMFRASCNKTPAKAFSISTEKKMGTQGGFSLHCSGNVKAVRQRDLS